MKKTHRILLFMIILFITTSSLVFAGGSSEGNAGYSLYYVPTNIVNNQGLLIELSQAKSVSASNVGTAYASATSYSYPTAKDLVICCLIDSLNDSVQTDNVEVSITDNTGFYFIKDGNPTSRIPYEIEVICSAFYKGDNSTSYANSVIDQSKRKMTIGGSSSIPISYSTYRHITIFNDESKNYSENTSFEKDQDTYTLSISPTKFTNTMDTWFGQYNETNAQYPNLMKYYYICLKVPGGTGFEEGTYTARLTINANFTSKSLTGDSKPDSISETISIKGYIGEEPEQQSDLAYSFFVFGSKDTYMMDLTQEEYYDIARVQFMYTEMKKQPNSPDSVNSHQRYKIYISPTDTYGNPGEYYFKKIGTESQEKSFTNSVDYELYVETGNDTYVKIEKASDFTGETSAKTMETKAKNYYSSGKIAGAGLYSNNTYYLYPLYSVVQTITGTNSTYKETWELDQEIFLKITPNTNPEYNDMVKQDGTYSSIVYFTVVTQ